MRKVIYKEWVRGIETEEYKKADMFEAMSMDPFIKGTNCYVEKEGLFHGFFPTSLENNDGSFGNFTEALIETADGNIANVHPSLVRFIDTSESEQRAEFAKAAMQGFLSNHQLVERLEEGGELFHDLVCDSISMANIMIAELKRNK